MDPIETFEQLRSCVRRDSWLLRTYALVLTACVAIGAVRRRQERSDPPEKVHFTQIEVERIDVVEPDGKLRMVIANRPRSIGPIYQGKAFGYPGGSRPGIVFFNDEGSENGGLTFAGRRSAHGKYAASTGLSFDQFDEDQVLFLQYVDENGRRNLGFTVADRADVKLYDLVQERDRLLAIADEQARAEALRKWQEPRDGQPLFAQRVYVGRDPSRAALVDLSDPQGRLRLRMKVDAAGVPSLEFLDESGRVTLRLPEAGNRK